MFTALGLGTHEVARHLATLVCLGFTREAAARRLVEIGLAMVSEGTQH